MNLLFGLLVTNDAVVDEAELAAMGKSETGGWRLPQQWQQQNVGLGLRSPTTSSNDTIVHAPDDGLTLVASARLINQDELSAALCLPATLSDAQWILAAWQRWRCECVHYLDGDWHFALWDARARRLFLARDHHGSSSLYYHFDGGCFAFASTQKLLLALNRIPRRPSLRRIAQIFSGNLGDGSETGYVDICRLPPAHTLTVDTHGLRVDRYWFPERLPPLHSDNDSALEAFLALYRRAVVCRLDGTGDNGVMLSGGLDSGSVAVLSAAHLAEQEKTILGFTAIPAARPDPRLARRGPVDEGPLAAAVAARAGNIRLTLVDAAETSPLAGIERMLSVHNDPIYPAGNSYWLASIYATAQAQGVTTLLTGTAGNNTVSWRGVAPTLDRRLLMARPQQVVDELRRMHARSGLSLMHSLWVTLAKPILRALRSRAQRQPLYSQITLAALHPDFTQQAMVAEVLANDQTLPAPTNADAGGWAQWRLEGPERWLPPTFHFEDSVGFGLNVLDPTADRRLMEFCLSLGAAHYHNGAQDRWLIRRAMVGRLPDCIRLARQRGRQSADLVARVHGQINEVDATLTRLAQHPLVGTVINLPRLSALATQIKQKPESVSQVECNLLLLRGLMTGLFLERF